MIKPILNIFVLVLFLFSILSCSKPIPVKYGNTIHISKKSIMNERDKGNKLEIKWFGTSNYLISLGESSIMTDPFVSYQDLSTVIFANSIQSNDDYIKKYYSKINTPDAIFIGHSHYDHLMDTVPFLRLKKEDSGCNVPIYGSDTTKNILHGYKRECDCSMSNDSTRWSFNSKIVETLGEWKPVEEVNCSDSNVQNNNIKYKAYIADHATHFKYGPINIKFFQGHQESALNEPPQNASEYKEGYTYFYMFKLTNNQTSYKVGLAGAATDIKDYELPYMKSCSENSENCIDVLIICVPGWKYKDEYPKGLIEKLRPRYIVLSHYDNFFEPNRYKKVINEVPLTDLDKFIIKIQDDIDLIKNYDRFESILLPDVNSTIYLN